MTRLSAIDYRRHLAADSARLRETLSATEESARVPACGDWDAADLLWHHADVLFFWAWVVEHRPQEPGDLDDPATHPARPAAYADLLALHEERATRLDGLLADAAADEPAWSWSEDHSVGFVLRRQAHEALVHRVDAEQTAGRTSPVDPALATDGVAELVEVMYGGAVPSWGRVDPGPHVVRLELTDTGQDLWVRPGRFRGTHEGTDHDEPTLDRLAADPGTDADAVVRGTAADVDLWLWGRADGAAVTQDGDADALEGFRAAVATPLD
ncbi:maleylpyruvate isomerase family mycothiol-dependent enzyme [Nocardioides sp. CFH 31398]|uniref:maleylpyruvate isomerase family mycothiol-dependent enzyme n=1 Tax=Nocardioides sp. CFH 31398 TaxID=2919579 RepID=UPI001F064E2F|nr:maleylpyruvate isomerase family mycothiol-dependent enzyme [Nocardioides sp. CFH 31398]MCH1868957.1 maleylpyruvate isomerase N-terminal domain-containing protein [Nocardioides sp. CFH 31398]